MVVQAPLSYSTETKWGFATGYVRLYISNSPRSILPYSRTFTYMTKPSYTREEMAVPRKLSIVPPIQPTGEQVAGISESFFQLENGMNILLNELAQAEFAGKDWDKSRALVLKLIETLRAG